jgi:hypothetical protein
MINPSAVLGGTANGRLAADRAINKLYLSNTPNTKAGSPEAFPPVRRAIAEVASMDKATATLLGQNCVPSQ